VQQRGPRNPKPKDGNSLAAISWDALVRVARPGNKEKVFNGSFPMLDGGFPPIHIEGFYLLRMASKDDVMVANFP